MSKEYMIKIFSGTMWEAGMITSLLKDADIDSFLKNVVLNSYAYEPISSESVHVMISEYNKEEAQAIIDNYTKSK